MAIKRWKTYEDKKAGEPPTVSYEGRVLRKPWPECERVMSDIYADVMYTLVWDDEAGRAKKLYLKACFECDVSAYECEVDASPEILVAHEANRKYEAALSRARKRLREARKAADYRERTHHEVAKDKRMVVHRSYKEVRRGMEGIVFWIQNRGASTRVGLRTSEEKDSNGRYKDVFWANASQLENAEPFEPEAWLVEELAEARAELEAIEAAPPAPLAA
ncbi:MAG: hypothetical protein AMK75_02595 [Planctomycetes bacterium SM23_65]|nr:MAG: hypothetical protein AMK75_02595 [Planctomycetes bacterium SM23_65]